MPRRCSNCHRETPPTQLRSCPHCRKEFTTSLRASPSTIPFAKHDRSPRISLGHIRPRASSSAAAHRITPRENDTPVSCQYKKVCAEYLSSLRWDKSFFDRQHNRCYCENCYSSSREDTTVQGGSKYVLPRGWCRFGLHVDQVRADIDRIWSKWIVTYHGTRPMAAQSIIQHRQFLLPGDTCIDGTKVAILPDHIPGKNHIYTSPTIAYSSYEAYCPPQRFHSQQTGKTYDARLVLQCRQQPGSYKVQGETINAGSKRLCPFIPNDQIEIFTEVRAAVVPYGVLIHLTEV
ncbi:unnamed protein product [Adineta ricciae]|uniref:Uncharacterized protein n=1 Tax=Adineta ricciae TaxID=249248 RepID=A0A814KZ24_ADIRI|nr:unnamed protein product [Adineta ricciae]CAF1091098.1 unnamed protein product [Adineta ricciae]